MKLTFQEATNKLGKRPSRKLENNTYLQRADENTICVRLHATNVVTLRSDNTYELNSDGWKTNTTKDRINEYSPARISQKKGRWYLGSDCEFYDGVIVDSFGSVVTEIIDPAEGDRLKAKVDRMVSKYIKGFCEDIKVNGIERPSGGDCWACCMVNAETGKGDMMGLSHLFDHFEEEYYVPSLLWNALKDSYNDPSFIWMMIEADAKRGSVFHGVRTALQKYFRKRKDLMVDYLKNLESDESVFDMAA